MLKLFSNLVSWFNHLGTTTNIEYTITYNGKKIDPSSKVGKHMIAMVDDAFKRIDEAYERILEQCEKL